MQNKPEVPYWARDYYEAFHSLSRHRQINQVEQPLSIVDIIAYGREFGFEDEMDSFLSIMGQLDHHFLTHVSEKRKQEMEEQKRKNAKKK